jgi:hypothetical protein
VATNLARKETHIMLDVIIVLATLVTFVVFVGFTLGCERL